MNDVRRAQRQQESWQRALETEKLNRDRRVADANTRSANAAERANLISIAAFVISLLALGLAAIDLFRHPQVVAAPPTPVPKLYPFGE